MTQAGLKRPEIELYGAESEVPLIMATYYNEHTAHFFGKYNWLVTFSANMDMRLFPFETLALSHTIQMAARLEPWEGEFNVANCPTPAVSNLLIKTSDTWSPVACKVSSEYTKSRMSIVRMELSVERNPSFFLTNILPINYILALSGVCVNAIDHREVGERMGIVFTLLLTTVAYKLLILDLVPQLPYSTVLGPRLHADRYGAAARLHARLTRHGHTGVPWCRVLSARTIVSPLARPSMCVSQTTLCSSASSRMCSSSPKSSMSGKPARARSRTRRRSHWTPRTSGCMLLL